MCRFQHLANPAIESPEPAPIIWSLDLISGICVALQANIVPVIANYPHALFAVIVQCIQDTTELPQTRQSALALIGDLAKVTQPPQCFVPFFNFRAPGQY